MNEKIEGTFALDGLIEGRFGDVEDPEQRLRDWMALARKARLPFSLETTGNRFSLLADTRPIPVEEVGADPVSRVSDALRELLRAFPPASGAGVFSTLRSTEVRPGEEVQTLYLATPDGDVQEQQRTVEAETTPREPPLSPREKARMIGIGVLVALALFGLSALFVPYRDLLSGLRERMTPTSADVIEVRAEAFEEWFTPGAERKMDPRWRLLIVPVTVSDGMPRTDEEFTRAIAEAGSSAKRLALEALQRGYARCEYFDAKGRFLAYAEVRLKDLFQQRAPGAPAPELALPLPREGAVRRIVLTY